MKKKFDHKYVTYRMKMFMVTTTDHWKAKKLHI